MNDKKQKTVFAAVSAISLLQMYAVVPTRFFWHEMATAKGSGVVDMMIGFVMLVSIVLYLFFINTRVWLLISVLIAVLDGTLIAYSMKERTGRMRAFAAVIISLIAVLSGVGAEDLILW